jgi:hypothetical protein
LENIMAIGTTNPVIKVEWNGWRSSVI